MRIAVDRIDRSTLFLVVGAMAAMAILVVGQVIFRYVFNSAIDWAEEVARLAFVWAMFLAIPHGIRRGVHVGIDALVVRFSQGLQDRLFRLSALIGAALMAVIFAYAWQVTVYTWPELMPTLNLTAAVYYIAILIAAVHSVLHLLLLAWGGRSTWEEKSAQ
ncbi:Tripartite ATP-independent periplasmic transporter, DctQ component [Litoreibacter arenae DSM 19593]|uniref:TRAP transporter small permease protein n=2 Tax=Litoreibacter TaxID=947567 RepID=S9QIK0_9RHOB|nr:Tripartite ATP-independent periplasmic transporter, DctQ component [Litoreibacter arenae DSM 19593]